MYISFFKSLKSKSFEPRLCTSSSFELNLKAIIREIKKVGKKYDKKIELLTTKIFFIISIYIISLTPSNFSGKKVLKWK